MDVALLKYGDVLEGTRGDRMMVIYPPGRARVGKAIVIRPDAPSYRSLAPIYTVGQRIEFYASWGLKLLETT